MRRVLLAMLAVVALVGACGESKSFVPTMKSLANRHFAVTSAKGFTLVEGTFISISFTSGSISANAGCNSGGGEFEIKDGKLVTDGFVQTEMYCEAPGVMEQEQAVFGMLVESPTINFVDNVLTLEGQTVKIALAEAVGGSGGE